MKRIFLLITLLLPQLGFAQTGYRNGHAWVDLGLPSGTLWATCNVGASSPEEYGDYFAWGETVAKTEFSWENYRFWTSGDGEWDYSEWRIDLRFSKYNTDYHSEPGAPVDNKTQLDPDDDAARVIWGRKWRIPTKEQWEELIEQCTWEWTGNGYTVTGPNGQSIFLPVKYYNMNSLGTGFYSAHYWSSSLSEELIVTAWSLDLTNSDSKIDDIGSDRYRGLWVRPVTK